MYFVNYLTIQFYGIFILLKFQISNALLLKSAARKTIHATQKSINHAKKSTMHTTKLKTIKTAVNNVILTKD